jgi:hypothetical protein
MMIRTRTRPRKGAARLLCAAILASPLLAPSAGQADCLLDYVECVEAASDLEGFPRRSIAGLVCYADLIQCLQKRLY